MEADAPRGEFGLISWLRPRANRTGRVALGIGDDCGILHWEPGTEQVVTCDMLMDGRHFQLDRDGAEAVGYKALAVNLSDIAAMAAGRSPPWWRSHCPGPARWRSLRVCTRGCCRWPSALGSS